MGYLKDEAKRVNSGKPANHIPRISLGLGAWSDEHAQRLLEGCKGRLCDNALYSHTVREMARGLHDGWLKPSQLTRAELAAVKEHNNEWRRLSEEPQREWSHEETQEFFAELIAENEAGPERYVID